MLFALGTVVASADASLAENLIIHYDFEGDTLEEQLSDKATGGVSKENINVYNTSTEPTLTITDGVAHIKSLDNPKAATDENVKKNSPYISDGFVTKFYQAPAEPDPDAEPVDPATASGADFINNQTGEYTFYLDFRVVGDGLTLGGYRDCFRVSQNSSTHLLRFFSGNCNTSTETKDYTVVSSQLGNQSVLTLPYAVESFYQFAITMKYDESTSKWNYEGYFSADGGQTYLLVMEASAENAKDYLSAATMLSFGNRNVKGATEYYYDDFRVYNKALTDAELVSIKYPDGISGEGDNENETGENESNTTPSENVTVAPTDETTGTPADDNGTKAETETNGNTNEGAGCASSLSVGAFALTSMLLAGVCMIKKKKD